MITRQDIAREAGVSVSVVSRALNNSGYVNKEKKDQIIKIANELGYHANPIALSLAQLKTKQILFYCSDLENAFNIMVYEGMVEEARKHGYMIMIDSNVDFDNLRSTMVDGIILPNRFAAQEYLEVVGANYYLPVVAASYGNTITFKKSIPVVESNVWEATNKAIRYLKDNGHRKIAMLMPYELSHSEIRSYAWKGEMASELGDDLEKYYLGISAIGLNYDSRVMKLPHEMHEGYNCAENFFEKGELGAAIFLERNIDATAVVAFNDEMALGFMRAINKLGKKIPDDISIIGIDGVYSRRYADKTLTSVSLNPKMQGAKCAELMINIIENKKYKYVTYIPSKLLEGETVKNIK